MAEELNFNKPTNNKQAQPKTWNRNRLKLPESFKTFGKFA
jgi:hypothetical protein